MIQIIPYSTERHFEEVQMGQILFYNEIIDHKFDGISVTANTNGFTPLTAVAHSYGMLPREINKASDMTNQRQEVCIFKPDQKNTLLVVPKTHNNDNLKGYDLMTDLLNACKAAEITSLRFMHYAFICGRINSSEIEGIVTAVKKYSQETTLEKIIFEIDSRNFDEIKLILEGR